jgi:molybdopterin converting factor small subunit
MTQLMTVRVLLFASWADALGARSIEIDIPEDATADDVLSALDSRAGAVKLPRPALAVNRSIVRPKTRIARGDELAIIPPVAGG